MTLLSRTRFVAALLAAVTLASAGCTSSSPSPQPAPSPSPTAVVEATPETSPEPSAEPSPELATEPEDLQAYCDAIQAIHDEPYAGPGRSSAGMAEAASQVVEVAPESEVEFWVALSAVYDATSDRDLMRIVVDQSHTMRYEIEERCGFSLP